MRPLRLEIEGFTAFRECQTVDFESLELFVITGPTGAGKTSILDAMVFALYGQVPRLGGKQGMTDLVSLGRNQARISFEFALDGGQRYRVARRLTRGAAQTATLQRLDGDEWVDASERGGVTGVNEALLHLLGLDFEAFTKAVVLPQGEFSRFLKGDTAERRRVLVALLGVSYFQRMAELARARATRLAHGIETIESILAEQFGDATSGRVTETETAARAAAARATRLADAVREAAEHARDAARHLERASAMTKTQGELATLVTEADSHIAECREAEVAHSDAGVALTAATDALEARRVILVEAEQALAGVESEVGAAAQLGVLIADAQRLQTGAERETAAREAVAAAEQALATAVAGTEACATAEQSARASREEAAAALRAWQEQATELEPAATALAGQLRDAHAAGQGLEQTRELAAAAAELVGPLASAAERCAVEAEVAEELLVTHRREHAVAGLVAGLAIGDPCPVCQIALKQLPDVAAEAVDAIGTAEAALASARTASAASSRALSDAEAQVSADQQLVAGERRLAAALGEHPDLAALERANTAAGAALGAARAELARLEEVSAESTESYVAAQSALSTATAEHSACETLLKARAETLATTVTDNETARQALNDYFGGDHPTDVLAALTERQARLRTATAAVAEARDDLKVQEPAVAQARVMVGTSVSRLHAIDVVVEGVVTHARMLESDAEGLAGDALPDASLDRSDALAQLAGACGAAVASLAVGIGQKRDAADAASARIAVLATDSGVEHGDDAGEPMEALTAAERAAADAKTRADAQAEHAAARAAQRAELEAQIATDREDAAVSGALATELRADRFGEYIVQETLDQLAVVASDELRRISGDRYSLVTDEGDFEVVDHVNADERRSVKTLSGGETFLASLALALALSRHVGELAGEGLGTKLQAVFIDEGFGTLDPDTLDDVIDALERLREDDLLVGVISHVPELADRIELGLRVRKVGNHSVIETR